MNRSNYPNEIAQAICDRWNEDQDNDKVLLSKPSLNWIVDVIYQASLLREESEPVRCRLIVDSAELSCESRLGKSHYQLVRFVEPVDLTPQNVRKLAAAAGYYRALLAIRFNELETPVIWGILATGAEWVNRVDAASDRHDDRDYLAENTENPWLFVP